MEEKKNPKEENTTQVLNGDSLGEMPTESPLTKNAPKGVDDSKSGSNSVVGSDAFNNSLSNAALQTLRQSDDEHLWRKQYLRKSFYLVSCILYITFFVVLLVGIGLVDLSDKVLMTMLGTTVAHVVGVLAIAFHWLYPHSNGVTKGV